MVERLKKLNHFKTYADDLNNDENLKEIRKLLDENQVEKFNELLKPY